MRCLKALLVSIQRCSGIELDPALIFTGKTAEPLERRACPGLSRVPPAINRAQVTV